MVLTKSDVKRRYDAAWRAANPERVRENYLASRERLKADPAKQQELRDRAKRRNATLREARPPDPTKALAAFLAEVGVKTCLRCRTPRLFSEFAPHKLGSNGLSSWCRPCCYAFAKTPGARAKSRAAKAARFAVMTPAERARARGSRRPMSKVKHDTHVVAHAKHVKTLARQAEVAARKQTREDERLAKRRALKIPDTASPNRKKKLERERTVSRATPAWASAKKIREMYKLVKKMRADDGQDWTVEHIVPLNSPLVCGLHVLNNLLPALRGPNSSKGNKYWPDMP